MKRREKSSLDHSLGKLKDNEILNENRQQQVRKRILSEIDQKEAKGHVRWGSWTKRVIPAFILLLAFAITISLFLNETNETTEQESSGPENEDNLSHTDEAIKDKENQDENIITSVLENTFNGPDKEFREVMEKGDKDFLKGYGQYMQDAFKPYFTNDFYEEYTATYGTAFLERAYRSDYEMKVKNINIETSDTDETIYNFTLKLQYKQEKREEWESDTIKGQANLDDNHLIKGMLIKNTEFLSNLRGAKRDNQKQENTTEGENDKNGNGKQEQTQEDNNASSKNNNNTEKESSELTKDEAAGNVFDYVDDHTDVDRDDIVTMQQGKEDGKYKIQAFVWSSKDADNNAQMKNTIGWYLVDKKTGEVEEKAF